MDPPHQQYQPSVEFLAAQKLSRRSAVPRPTSSGFFSFMRWFRRHDHTSNTSDSEDESAPASPLFSSCDSLDSVFSTATATSFAYVPPVIYKPFGTASVPEKFIAPGQETHTYRRRIKQRDRLRELDRNLTLRKKYRLFAAETLTSDKTSTEYKKYSELSLPHIKQSECVTSIGNNVKRHRRSASESSKDRRAGAYLHVKGKRRAPPPPIKHDINISMLPSTNSLSSTSSRKKRKAPLPPIVQNEVRGNTPPEPVQNMDTPSTSKVDNIENNNTEEFISNDSLRLEKGVLKPAKSILEEMPVVKQIKDVPPVSPRPWYKRAGNFRDTRRDKTLEKHKEKTAFSELNQYKVGNEGNFRFSFFSKLNEKSEKKDTEKRKSGMLMLANISELDREAAEIISIQQAREKAIATAQDDQFYDIPGFIRSRIIDNEANQEDIPEHQSAKELISRFNAITNVTKITINAAFLNSKDSKLFSKSPKLSSRNLAQSEDFSSPVSVLSNKAEVTPPFKRSIFSVPGCYNVRPYSSSYVTKESDQILKSNIHIDKQKTEKPNSGIEVSEKNIKLESSSKISDVEMNKSNPSETWLCRHCTLKNPVSKFVCEACTIPRPSCAQSESTKSHKPSPNQLLDAPKKTFDDWEKEIKRYFPNKTKHNEIDESLVKKSSSDKSVFKSEMNDPNIENCKETAASTTTETVFTPIENPEVIINEADNKNSKFLVKPNMEEIRKIRLARFSANLEGLPEAQMNAQENASEQDRLFEKLREMKNSLQKPVDKTKTEVVIEADNDSKSSIAISPDVKKVSNISENNKGAIKKTQFLNNKLTNQTDIDKPAYKDKELFVVTTQTELEDIKVKNGNIYKPLKVSSSCQTSGVIRKVPCESNGASGNNKSIEEKVLDKELYEDPKIHGLRIRNRIYELLGPRDFADIKQTKMRTKDNYDNTYENISPIIIDNNFDKLTEEVRKSNLKENLQNHDLAINNNTLTINKLLRSLENAIAEGKQTQASQLAKDLANLKISCSVTRQKHVHQSNELEANIALDFYVEDKISHQGPFSIQVSRTTTVQQLKEKIARDFEIPIIFQRWIIGSQLASDDTKTLEQLRVKDNGSQTYLYLVAPEPENEAQKKDPSKQHLYLHTNNNSTNGIEEDHHNICENQSTSQNYTKHFNVSELSCNDSIENAASSQESNQVKEEFDWTCTTCTLNNSFFSEKCSICCAAKPLEMLRHKKSNKNMKEEHYLQLLNLDNMDIVPNIEPFKCSVCFDHFCIGEGVTLRECLHTFCRECLADNIRYCDEPVVKCPYRDDQYTCDYAVQEREIKALVSPEVYEQHLAKSIAQAENRIQNAFHCKTPNCLGWCIFEDNVNLFLCPVCSNYNCLTCQVIHTNLDCRQYQEKMKLDSETNLDARRTKEMLKELVDKGEAMPCPTCQVVLMKKWGCDWLRCSMCKTEICWVTRGPRWGPKGKGDVTGGCKCGVDGRKCHAKCNYCH